MVMAKNKSREMTTMPASPVEAEAIASVRQLVERFRYNLSPELSRDFLREHMSNMASHSVQCMMLVAKYARAGDDFSDSIMRDLWLGYANRGEAAPTVILAYIMEREAAGSGPPRGRGRRRPDYFMRDIYILLLVEHVVIRFGLRPSRSSASKRPSACSVVAEAFSRTLGLPGMTEKAVEAVWNRLAGGRGTQGNDPFAGLPVS